MLKWLSRCEPCTTAEKQQAGGPSAGRLPGADKQTELIGRQITESAGEFLHQATNNLIGGLSEEPAYVV